jgi:hypothetical protein
MVFRLDEMHIHIYQSDLTDGDWSPLCSTCDLSTMEPGHH